MCVWTTHEEHLVVSASFNVMRVWLENAYSCPLWELFGVKCGKMETLRSFVQLVMQ